MHFSLTDTILWGAGFIANSVLLCVLLFRRRSKILPWFTAWIAFQVLYTVVLYCGFRWGPRHLYADLYWSGATIDFLLQVGLVVEVAHIVLQTSGEWAEGAKVRFYGIGLAGAVFAGSIAWWIAPAAPSSLDAWEVRGNLFTTMLICCSFTGIMSASQRLGLVWRGYVMRLGNGLIAWSFVAFATDTLHSYWGTETHFRTLDHIRQWVYLGAVLYWSVAFWLPEAASKEFSPRMHGDLIDLQARVGTARENGTML